MIDVSVIIISLNEEKNIARCLESVKKQSFPQERIEIIVVDNNSTDETVEIARQFTDKVYSHGPERSPQKNFGVVKSSGKYILHLDGDMIISENLVKECFEKSEKEGHIAIYIPEIVVGDGIWIKSRNFERSFYDHTCITAPRFLSREKYLEIGGYDISLIAGEDWDLDRRINEKGTTSYVDVPLYHNEGKLKLRGYMKSRAYYSNILHKYIEKWGRNDPLIKKQLGLCYRYFGVFIENGKWKKLIRHPILTIGMYFLRFMVGIQYLMNRKEIKN